ncbi:MULTISPECIES: dihydrodipicolinate synthase family protein [unclassified Saccharopolyspora]|uniref:dihydrodipicolinate synthase family protein n=1 Tax=unclassified Saccharopolyspora TaxID=2646250 RepID=UPI001CD1B353|nr:MULTISPECIES: dihydrodipicolinate synthase family protein [unclassified Saccharopolyspora]MCA1188160.1 dihydrodipicolinate synthase family protein [Saccharopolyspora sp. 6T]MCA1195226.1 dihydrodipicolinate synthase family protein [Saccharopolyspora sp. 6V]MCA1227064.1 dihydrodipicolinate synthase family protein [Saccharopolyspora sp. 6M]MCA1282695.1 dihydrodipicolinate synthase family protein [Saccharopolyspora sp. 7B]
MESRIRGGVVPPVCTPLTPDLEVDTGSLERLLEHLLASGVDGVFALGSTGEMAYLTDAQREQVLRTTTAVVAGRVPVLAGVIDTTTPRVREHVRVAERAGCDAVVATAPFYTRTHPAEIAHHFRLLAESTELPLFAYDIPVSVHSKLGAATLLELAADGVLAGVKDSSGDDAALRGLLVERADRGLESFRVFTGSELTVDTNLRMGADGVVPGLGNVDPDGYVRLARACAAGEWDAALAEQERLVQLFALTSVGDPARIGASSSALGAFKAGLHLRGVIDHAVTAPPQLPLTADEVDGVRQRLVAAGLL